MHIQFKSAKISLSAFYTVIIIIIIIIMIVRNISRARQRIIQVEKIQFFSLSTSRRYKSI